MKRYIVELTSQAQKDLRKMPRHILVQFDVWVESVETDGYTAMKAIKGYRDHALKGDRQGQRSVSLSRSYRVIYELKDGEIAIVEVQEVNKHEYKK